jgi:class 3 adenylate cyclase
VGSTAISAQLDAEEWRDLVGAYLDAASAAITEMGGQVAKKLGDGLMALFGFAASETKAAAEQARLLMDQAEKLGEPLEDSLLLFSVLYGVC